MRTHGMIGVGYRVGLKTASSLIADQQYYDQANAQYLENSSGPLSSLFGNIAWETVPSKMLSNVSMKGLNIFPPDWPNVKYIGVSVFFGRYTDLADPGDGYNYAAHISNVSPLSRGNISIVSPSTSDPSIIDPAWHTHSAHVEVLVAGYKRARQILRPHLDEIIFEDEYWPGVDVTTDDDIQKMIAESIAPIYHPYGTCSMGRKGDPQAVVDSKARVFGVHGLRVVDASAFPILPPGHPMSTAYALSEKIADDILKD